MRDRGLWMIDAAGAAALLALAGAVYTLAWTPLRAARAQARAHDEQIAARREQADRLAHALRSLDQRLDEARRSLEAAPLLLRPVEQVNARVADLTALAAAHSIRLDQVAPGSPLPGPRYTRVPIILSGAGAYADFVEFLHLASAGGPDTGVVRFDAGCGGPCTADAPATFTIELVWFAAGAASAAQGNSAGGAAGAVRGAGAGGDEAPNP